MLRLYFSVGLLDIIIDACIKCVLVTKKRAYQSSSTSVTWKSWSIKYL